jgi:hypothetical protein
MIDELSKSVIDVKLWKIVDNNPIKVEKRRLGLEKNLEDWIEKDTTILDENLLLIGRQVKNIDLLFLDRNGNTVIAELKREKTPRDVVTQIIEYASWVESLGYEDLKIEAEKTYKQPEALKVKFRERFDEELPETLNEQHRMIIVAAGLDDSTRKIIEYLAHGKRNVPINVAIFHYFEDNGSKHMARTFLIEPSKLEDRETFEVKRKPIITMEEFVKNYEIVGVGELAKKIKEIYDKGEDWDIRLYTSGLGMLTYDGDINVAFNVNPDADNGVWVNDPELFEKVADIGRKLGLEVKIPLAAPAGVSMGKIIRFNHIEGLIKLTPKFEELLNELKKIK